MSAPINPSNLYIVRYPAEILRERADEVPEIDSHAQSVAQTMIQLMAEAPGIGLAAPQVGLPWRLFVAHVPPDPEDPDPVTPGVLTSTKEPTVYFNPKLTDFSKDLEPYDEGCLSLPEITGTVRRPSTVTITALDSEGNEFTHRASGLLARCWQHEMDHLDGVLIIDKFSPMDTRRSKRAIQQLELAARPAL